MYRKPLPTPKQPNVRLRPPEPATASDFIGHLSTLHRCRGILEVILYCRVSGRWQEWKQNLDDQEANLRKWMERYGIKVVAVHRQRVSGWKDDDQLALREAIADAKRLGIPIVAETVDRYIRHEDYHSEQNSGALPTEDDFAGLTGLADGVTLATLIHPDAPPETVRWFQQDRGQKAKGRCGGRPVAPPPGDKKRRRLELLPKVREMREQGDSLRAIANEVAVPLMTLSDWLRRSS